MTAEWLPKILSGLLNNFLLMFLSSIIPAGIGIGLTLLMKSVGTKGIRLTFRIIGAVFYSMAPIVLLLYLYFFVAVQIGLSILIIVLALTIPHLGWFAMFFDAEASAAKNIVVNTLGLLSSTFMWSMVSNFIGYRDIVGVSNYIRGMTYNVSSLLIVLLITVIILAALNVPRMILKEKMK